MSFSWYPPSLLDRSDYDAAAVDASFGGFDLGHFIGNAVSSAGKAIGDATKSIGDETGKIGNALSKVPAVGPLLHGVWGAMGAPFDLTYRIAKGERLDHALIDHFKNDIQNVKEVAPYAKMVISFVPGVGTAVSAAIGAATAIVSGQPITSVLMEAVKGAIPGGEIAASVFTAATDVVSGKGIDAAAVDVLPIPDGAKGPIKGALKLAESVASGKPPGDALVQTTMAVLPPDVQQTLKGVGADKLTGALADAAFKEATKQGMKPEQAKALQVGVAAAHAQRLQGVSQQASSHPHTLAALAQDGLTVEAKTPEAAAAKRLLGGRGENGFDTGLGLMQYTGINPHAVLATREAMGTPDDKLGFNAALALHIGRVRAPAPPSKDPNFLAGYFVSKGMQGGEEESKAAIMQLLSANPQARAGAARAVNQIHQARGLPPVGKPTR